MYPTDLAKLAYARLKKTKSQIAREYRKENRYNNVDMFECQKYGYTNKQVKMFGYGTFDNRLKYSDDLRKRNIKNRNSNKFHLYHPNHQVHQ